MKLSLSAHLGASCPDAAIASSLFQSRFWARFQKSRGVEARLFSLALGDEFAVREPQLLSVLVRTGAAGIRYAYVPRGPGIDPGEAGRGAFLEQLSVELAPHLGDGVVCIRFDTAFESPYTDDEYWTSSGQWKGAPRAELRELRMNFGTGQRALRKSPTDHLSPDTVILDLRGTEDEILARMRQTTRNSVRKAVKSGAEFRVGGAESLEDWHRLYRETAERKGFYFEELPYFETLLSTASGAETHGPADISAGSSAEPRFAVITACKDGRLLAGCVVAAFGAQGYYLYAGSSTEMRECMPNYGIQLEAIRWLKGQGCLSYDLMGVPPNGDPNHSMYGLYTFKTGLGGRIAHYAGCWDWPLDADAYAAFSNAENICLS